MPYVNLQTNVKVNDKTSIKAKLGQLIAEIPTKAEYMTMVSIYDNVDLYFGGSDEPCAIIETLVNKGTDMSRNKEYCNAVVDMLSKELNIPVNKIYAMVDEEDYWFVKLK